MPPNSVVAWFARAANYLHRRDPRCPEHRVAHTGKLARAIVLDLALLDATGDDTFWQRATTRAQFVASRLAPDPEHGAFIYLPGRLDPRNCSNSIIDSGECTGALATLLAYPRAATLPADVHVLLEHAVERNAETYLIRNVIEKEITNQRLWGAMGLAAAYKLQPRAEWLAALEGSLHRSIAEQHADGSWPYHPDPKGFGQHAGAADVSVYYQGRCLAFLIAILEVVPDLDQRVSGWLAVERGLEFLAAVTLPNGLKPLALEGKRWFWDSPYEAGSNAYDVFALLGGAEYFARPEWAALAAHAWWQLARHQQHDGSIRAGASGAADFVCPDFHTADLAWPAQVMGHLRDPEERPEPIQCASVTRHFPDAGLVSLSDGETVALIRTAKAPRNTLYGGAVGGGSPAAVSHASNGADQMHVARESPHVEASFTLYPVSPARLPALRRFLRDNPPQREGRQWLFVARLLLAQRRPLAALRRLWRVYFRPLLDDLVEPIATHYSTTSDCDLQGNDARIDVKPALPDGTVPGWAGDILIRRRYRLDARGLSVEDQFEGGARAQRVTYRLPGAAHELQVESSGDVERVGEAGRLLVLAPGGRAQTLRISYRL